MYSMNFMIPLNKDELLDGNSSERYCVQDVAPVSSLPGCLAELCKTAGIVIGEGVGVGEIALFQHTLPKYHITAFDNCRESYALFEGLHLTLDGVERKHIDLLYGDRHFDLILSVTGAFACGYYYRPCRVPYDHLQHYKCPQECDCCFDNLPCNLPSSASSSLTPLRASVPCDTCHRVFYREGCFWNHLLPRGKGKSTCVMVKACCNCFMGMTCDKRRLEHICGERYCSACRKYVRPDHLCHMTPLREERWQ